MVKLILLIFISFCVPVIGIVGLKTYGIKKDKSLKIIAISLLVLEIFKFFYNASLYENGATPIESLSFSIITLLVVTTLFGAFGNQKLQKTFANLSAYCSVVPIILAIFNHSVYEVGEDTHAMLTGMYFLQTGLLMIFSVLHFSGNKDFPLSDIVYPVIFLGFFLGLTAFTNYCWTTNFLFTQDTITNVLMMICILFMPVTIYLISLLIPRKQGGNK